MGAMAGERSPSDDPGIFGEVHSKKTVQRGRKPLLYWFNKHGEGRNQFAIFERRFDLKTVPPDARLHVFADSMFRLWINGRIAAYGPARFLPRQPQYETICLEKFLRTGENHLVLEANARGAPSYQAVPSRGGVAIWGAAGDEDLSLPVSWTVRQGTQWDANAEPFSFAQGPVEIRDLRIESTPPREPLSVQNQEHWGDLEERTIPGPSMRFLPPCEVKTAALLDAENRCFQWRGPETPGGRTPFFTHIFSPGTQQVEAGILWGPLACNGRICHPESSEKGLRETILLPLVAGWNFVCGLSENLTPFWTWQIALPRDRGLFCHWEPTFSKGSVFALGPVDFSPSALREFLDRPPANWQPRGLHKDFHPLPDVTIFSPAKQLAWERVESRLPNFQADTTPWVFETSRSFALVLDFGGEFLGHPSLEIEAPAGTVVDFACDERLREDGLIDFYRCNPFVNAADRFVLTEGRQRIETFHERGGRFLQITVRPTRGPVLIHQAGVRQTSADIRITGEFECDDPLFNWIWQAGTRTLEASTADGWIDPWRERGLYLGDALVQGHATRTMTSDWQMDPWVLRLFARAQRPDGQLPDSAPSHHEQPLNDYSLLWIVALRNYWAASGDVDLVSELWPVLERILESPAWQEAADGLWEVNDEMRLFIDWGVVPEERLGVNPCLNILRHAALDHAAELAAALGKTARSREFASGATPLGEAIVNRFWCEEEGRLQAACLDGQLTTVPSLHANALAIAFGVLDSARSLRAADYLCQGLEPEKLGEPGHCELYFLYFVLAALYRGGRIREAEEVLRTYHRPMRDAGAWTLWERLDRGSAGLDSLCHGWATSGMVFFSERVLGVRPAVPGRPEHLLIAPESETLTRASGRVPHPDGIVEVSWEILGDDLHLRCRRPPGVSIAISPQGRLARYRLICDDSDILEPTPAPLVG